MSGPAAVAGACEAVVRLLRASYRAADFGGAALDFQAYVAEDFTHPMDQGVSLFLFRVQRSGAVRQPRGRTLPDGRVQRPRLPLDLHVLLTVWAKKASLQHEILGWMLRVLEDHPALTREVLDAYRAGVFAPADSVEVIPTELTVEETVRIWEVIAGQSYVLSVPFVLRTVYVESTVADAQAPVLERAFDVRQLEVAP